MGRFVRHQYSFLKSELAAWIKRLSYFYGADTKFTVRIRGVEWERKIRVSQFAEQIGESKCAEDAGIVAQSERMAAETGQGACFSPIPESFYSSPEEKGNGEVSAGLVQKALQTMEDIAAAYEEGEEMLLHLDFSEEKEQAQAIPSVLATILREACRRFKWCRKAFYDAERKRFYIVAPEDELIELDERGVRMGETLQMDLDDGFTENPTAAMTECFERWVQAGRPAGPILPWNFKSS